MFLVSIFLTASRSGVLVLVFALLFTLKRKHVVLWFSIFLLLTVILLFIPAEHITRLSTLTTLLPGSSSPEPNIALRFEFIKAGFKIFLKNPILGVGPGNYDYQIVAYGLDRKPAHNVYVSVLAEMGFTGFVIYLLLYYVIFRDYLRAIKTISRFDTELKNMVESLFLSFLVFAVGQMTNVYPIDTFFVTIVSLCVALRTIFSRYDMVA
jgi:O-antigen ligase